MRVARSGLAVGTVALVAACSLLTNVDGLSGSDASPELPDAASSDALASDDGGALDVSSVPSDSDAGATADGSGPCGARLAITPVEANAVDPTDGRTLAPTCDLQNLLVLDDAGAGLDQVFPNQVQGSLAGQGVSACVGARFDRDVAEAIVNAKSMAGACTGYACLNGCTSAGRYRLFVGSDLTTLSFVDVVSVGDAGYESYRTPVPADARWVVVCRGVSAELPDINVDVILGCVDP